MKVLQENLYHRTSYPYIGENTDEETLNKYRLYNYKVCVHTLQTNIIESLFWWMLSLNLPIPSIAKGEACQPTNGIWSLMMLYDLYVTLARAATELSTQSSVIHERPAGILTLEVWCSGCRL